HDRGAGPVRTAALPRRDPAAACGQGVPAGCGRRPVPEARRSRGSAALRAGGGEGDLHRGHRTRGGAGRRPDGGQGEAHVRRGGSRRTRYAAGASTLVSSERMPRVVVTGVGVITPIGIGRQRFWSAVLAGTSAVAEVTSFDTSRYKVHRGCEVRDF